MEDAHQLLPTANLQALNNVHLHLCVMNLSEITEASGLFILLDYITTPTPSQGSTLTWPNQPLPLPANWRMDASNTAALHPTRLPHPPTETRPLVLQTPPQGLGLEMAYQPTFHGPLPQKQPQLDHTIPLQQMAYLY